MIDLGTDGRQDYVAMWLRYAEDGTETLSREWLLPFLLLSLRERDLRGSELLCKIEDLGFGTVRSGEIYRVLWKAEREGLVFFEPGEGEHGLSRWRYGLTGVGEAYLEFLVNALELYSKEISVFFGAYNGPALRGVRG